MRSWTHSVPLWGFLKLFCYPLLNRGPLPVLSKHHGGYPICPLWFLVPRVHEVDLLLLAVRAAITTLLQLQFVIRSLGPISHISPGRLPLALTQKSSISSGSFMRLPPV